MFKPCCFLGGLILALCLTASSLHAQPTITNVHVGTAFRYQGAIRGVFPNSVFPNPGILSGTLQFEFGLWNDPVDTNVVAQVGTKLLQTLSVSNGFFSTMLDFGHVFQGRRTFLQVSVFAPSNTFPASSNWITVGPRSEIGAVPYAMWAGKVGSKTLRSLGTPFVFAGFGPFSAVMPGGYELAVANNNGRLSTNSSFLEAVSRPVIVDAVRILIGSKGAYGSSGPCLACYCAVTLEVWSLTNTVYSDATDFYQERKLAFARTLSEPLNVVMGTAPLNQWMSLSITNSNRSLGPGEQLLLMYRNSTLGGDNASGSFYITGEADVRDAP